MSEILNPFELYFGQDGRPISAGSLYIGVAGLDPQLNPIDVFYDREMTIPAMQPLNISGGYVWNCCAPTKVFAEPADYSLKVLGKNGEQVFYCQTVELLDDASRIGYLAPFTGAQTRTQADKNADFVSVRDFYIATDLDDWGLALTRALNAGSRVYFPSRTIPYQIKTAVSKTVTANISIDFGGNDIDIINGAGITIKGGTEVPFLSTVATSDLLRGGTSFACASVAGVVRGDLVSVQSPVLWAAGIPLRQHYIVQDVDSGTNTIYVQGVIVGEISTAQIGGAGSLTVDFYKIPYSIDLLDGNIMSSGRAGADILVNVIQFSVANYNKLGVSTPNRTGVNTTLCGFVYGTDCSIKYAGYVNKDQGYNSVPSSPSGLSFGYGFLTVNSYAAVFSGCNSFSAWHGFDFARGLCVAIINGCTAHKDALAWSTHEGQWTFIVNNSTIVGGGAVTTRSCDFICTNNNFRGSLGRVVIGNASHQTLVFNNNIVDVRGGVASNFIFLTGSYPENCYDSTLPPVICVTGNIISGIGNLSTIACRGGTITFSDNHIYVRDGSAANIKLSFTTNAGSLIISENQIYGSASQYPFEVSGNTNKIVVEGNTLHNDPTLDGALIYFVSGTHASFDIVNNKILLAGKLFRNASATFTEINVIGNYAPIGRIGLSAAAIVVKNSANNVFGNRFAPAWNITITKSLNDVYLLEDTDQAIKTVTYDPPSLAAGAIQSTVLTLTGAILGDIVTCSFSRALGGTRMWAEVTATDTVTVYHQNLTGSTVDLASGTLKVKVV